MILTVQDMNLFVSTFFGDQISPDEKLYNFATLLIAAFSTLFASLGVMFLVPVGACGMFFFMSVVMISFVYINTKIHKTLLFTILELCLFNFFAYPYVFLKYGSLSVEIPIYFIVGLVYALVLLNGVIRAVYFTSQFLVDIILIYYVFLVRGNISTNYGVEYYLRIECAVISVGVMTALLLRYRMNTLSREFAICEAEREKAKEVSFAKDMFLVNVSHEIRTPLNAIIGTLDMLSDSDVSNRVKDMIYNISNASHALLSITSDLLNFSRINSDYLSTMEERFDMSYMLNDIVNLINVRLMDSNVDFKVHVNAALPKIVVSDQGKLRQLIIYMLTNSMKNTERGYIDLSVDFDYRASDLIYLKIMVSDTGSEIPSDILSSIMAMDEERFNSYDEGDSNFLNLIMCMKICKSMRGSFTCGCELSGGSAFAAEIPLKLEVPNIGGIIGSLNEDVCVNYFVSDDYSGNLREILNSMDVRCHGVINLSEFLKAIERNDCDYFIVDSAIYESIKEELKNSGLEWHKLVVIADDNYSYADEPFEYVLTKPVSVLNLTDLFNHTLNYAIRHQSFHGSFEIPDVSILVVDDNLVNLDVAAGLLEKYSPKIITASGGKEALVALETEDVDLILLDYMMPDMDGIDTLKAIRALPNEKYKEIPIIVLTANVVSGAREMFMEAGFDDYLSKPIEIEKFEKMLVSFLPPDKVRYKT